MTEARIFTLIGQMLGASLPFATGTVSARLHGDSYTETFWQIRGRVWRVERSDGLTFTERVGQSSTARHGARVEAGPSAGVARFACGQLLRPAGAMVWGRPGEDWRLTGDVVDAGQGLWQVRLASTKEVPSPPAHLTVDERTGVLHELYLGEENRLLLQSLETVDFADLDEEALLRP